MYPFEYMETDKGEEEEEEERNRLTMQMQRAVISPVFSCLLFINIHNRGEKGGGSHNQLKVINYQ